MRAVLGLSFSRVVRNALALLLIVSASFGSVSALETSAPNPSPKPAEAPLKPDAIPLNDPGTARIPDAFAPRLNGADDDKDSMVGESIVLPPSPPRRTSVKVTERPVMSHPVKVDEWKALAINFDALLTLNGARKPISRTPPEPVWVFDAKALEIDFAALTALGQKPAPPVLAPPEPVWVFDAKALEIDFAGLLTIGAPQVAATAKPTLPDPFSDLKLLDLDPDQLELALTVETQLVKPGEDAVFSLSGPDDYLRDVSGDYTIGDELGRQLAHGMIVFAPVSSKGQPRGFQLTPPAELLLPAEKYHNGGAGLKLHADFAFASPGKKSVKLGGDFGIDAAAEPRSKEPKDWDRWIALTSSPPANGSWTRLNTLGITGGMQIRTSVARRESLRRGAAPFYVENVTRQMLSRYHTEKGLWQKTIAAIDVDRGNGKALSREPSLCSPQFGEAFGAEIQKISEAYVNDAPLFFSLSSEPSMTRLNAAADFDFTPAALDEFRRWLERDAYGTLPALNEGWGTHFESWQTVVPMTTDDARMRLKDGVGNFAPWADFREFQDYTFAKVLREGADLLRTKIPNAKVGVTGAMGPFAFGGWDWSRLAADLDVVEAYDIGGARGLWRDLALGKPALAALTLAPDGGAAAAPELTRALWQFALDGGPRGALFWDSPVPAPAGAPSGSAGGSALIDANGEATGLAKALAPTLTELSGAAGQLLAQARRMDDGVALLYSPASIRVQWLFEADKLHGTEWLQTWGADSSAERRESPQLRLRESWAKLLDDCGLGWRFISSRDVEHGELTRPEGGIKTLILPRAIAMSDREVEAITQFAANGGRVIADASCARFDEHGKLRARPALDDLFGVNTASEPVFSRPMKALNRVTPLTGSKGPMLKWDAEFCGNLPPVFSDEPKWLDPERSGKRRGAEYRLSPVFAARDKALYLNLDLTDYLRWRLHPELPRARTTRKTLTDLAFQETLDASALDWVKTKLPTGTQVVRLRAGACTLLALRRNPQARLHELGMEGDGNWAFEKPEPFELAFNADTWLTGSFANAPTVNAHEKSNTLRSIAGILDPVKPTILLLRSEDPGKLELSAVPNVVKLQRFEIAVQAPKDAPTPALFAIRVTGPDAIERSHYGGIVASKDAALSHVISFALNDPTGVWTVAVRNVLSGASAEIQIDVQDAEK